VVPLTALRRIAERNVAEVERVVRSYFNRLDDLEPVTRKQLQKLIREGAVTVLDVRPHDEFALGHVPGAVNIPLRALKERLAEINPDREIVAYCRGEYCVLSFEAVALLRARGFKVRRLEEGSTRVACCRVPDQNWKCQRSLNVCFWHKADVTIALTNVRFWE
jgi:rhodanese-related sulfurtransferase